MASDDVTLGSQMMRRNKEKFRREKELLMTEAEREAERLKKAGELDNLAPLLGEEVHFVRTFLCHILSRLPCYRWRSTPSSLRRQSSRVNLLSGQQQQRAQAQH